MIRKFFLLYFILIWCNLYGQKDVMRFNNLTTGMGLSNGDVTCTYQDNMGFVWIGTVDGLNRYNGLEFEVFKHDKKDSTTLPGNYIYDVLQDSKNNLWIGLINGLCKYNYDLNNFERINYKCENGNKKEINVEIIFEDDSSNLWIGGSDALFLIDEENEKFISYFEDIFNGPFADLSAIQQDAEGNVWFASTAKGLVKYNLKKKKVAILDTNNLYHGIKCFYVEENYLWLGYENNGFSIINKNNEIIAIHKSEASTSNSLNNNAIHSILVNDDGRLLLGTTGGGLNIFNRETRFFSHYLASETNRSLLSNNISDIYKSKDGIIWISCWGGGVSTFDKRFDKFIHYKQEEHSDNSIRGSSVTSFAEDINGNIWIGTDGGGISFFNPTKKIFKNYISDPSQANTLTNDKVLAVETDLDGGLWVGMWQGGLNYFKINGDKLILTKKYNNVDESNKKSNSIFNIYCDNEGNIWVGNFLTGLYLYNRNINKFESIPILNNFGDQITEITIMVILKDSKNNLWIGCQGAGLIKYNIDSKEKMQYRASESNKYNISSDIVVSLFEDSQDRLWVGTGEGGICLYNDEKEEFITYTTDNGLPDNTIKGILEDTKGNLWLSTSKGISKATIDDITDTLIIDFRNYTTQDGLQDMVFNYWSSYKSSTGDMYFGGLNGFNVFNPESIKDNQYKPPVHITNFSLFNKPVEIGGEGSPLIKDISQTKKLVLNHHQSVFSFEFIALNYIFSEKNQYAYMMEGFDDDWNYIGSKREATYTNLDPGNYIFRVKASNNDGIWNEEGTSLNITILPPWWMTWWFRILLGIFIIGGAITFYRVRIKILKQRQEELERQVKLRTKELNEANNELQIRQEEILAQNEEIQQQSEELAAQRDSLEEQNEEIISKNEQVSKAYDNMRVLSEVGQKLTSSLNIIDINDMIYDYVSSLMDTSAFGIGLLNTKMNVIEYPSYFEKGKKLPYFYRNIESKESLTSWSLVNKKIVFVNDLEREYKKYLENKPVIQTDIYPHSLILVPLLIEGNAIGVVSINSNKKGAYTENDLNNLQSLASYISIAIDNAKVYEILNKQNDHIKSSIEYAKSIQNSILPIERTVRQYFDPFFIFKPKDIVSGDFYWLTTEKDKDGIDYILVAAVDCTGHGVPGAFMSLIGSRLLNEIVNQRKILNPAQILEFLNIGIQISLKQDQTNNNDGMDVCLCCFKKIENGRYKLIFSGAKRPLYVYHNLESKGEMIKGSRKSIGGVRSKRSKVFYENHEMELNPNDIIYLTTDGLVDQNSADRKKFGSIKLNSILKQIYTVPMNEQKERIEKELDNHMQNEQQRDDITFIGLKLL